MSLFKRKSNFHGLVPEKLQMRGILYSLAFHAVLFIAWFLAVSGPDTEYLDFDLSPEHGISRAHSAAKKKVSIIGNEYDESAKTSRSFEPQTEGEENTEIETAEDIAFFPGAVAPRPLSRLKMIYPRIARELEIEAVAYVSAVISSEGKVLKVEVVGVTLSKQVSLQSARMIKKEFSIAAKKIIQDTRFSPAIVKGKKVPVIMDIPLNFSLD